MRDALLRDNRAPATPGSGRGRVALSLASEVAAPSCSGARHRIPAVVCFIPLRVVPVAMRSVVLLWALILAPTSVAGHPASREEGPPSNLPAQVASTGRVPSGAHANLGRFGSGTTLRMHKLPLSTAPAALRPPSRRDRRDVPAQPWRTRPVSPFLVARLCPGRSRRHHRPVIPPRTAPPLPDDRGEGQPIPEESYDQPRREPRVAPRPG
jgi:hypothetical protein